MSASGNGRARVLVAEKIGDSGVELLRDHFDVEVGVGWSPEQLTERIADFDGILIRSATKLDAGLIAHAERLRAVGRAGVGQPAVVGHLMDCRAGHAIGMQ